MPDFRVKVTIDSRDGTAHLGELENAERKAGQEARHSAEFTLEYKEAVDKLKESAKAAFGIIGIGFGVEELFRDAIDATSKFDKALSQVKAGILSTGGAAGVSSSELQELAEHFQNVTTYSHTAVLNMESILLTFTKVGSETFPRASQAILDMATRMGTDLTGAAVQVGKALQDPVTGITALHRVGVAFSSVQKDLIKNFVDTGQTAKAQEIILKELETEFGGSAAAAKNTLGGAMSDLKNLMDDFLESLGAGLTPALREVAQTLGDFLSQNKEVAQQIGQELGDAIITTANVLKFFAQNWDLIVKAFVVFASYKVGMLFVEIAEGIKEATAAEALFNAVSAASPWGLLAAAIGLVLYQMHQYTAAIEADYQAEQKRLALSGDIKKFLDDTRDRTEALTVAENEHAQALINTSKVEAEQARLAAERDQKELDRLKKDQQDQYNRMIQATGGSAARTDLTDLSATSKISQDEEKIKDLTQKIQDEKGVATEAEQHLALLEKQVTKLGVAHKDLADHVNTSTKAQKSALDSLKDWLKEQDAKIEALKKEADAAQYGQRALKEQEIIDAANAEALKRELELKKQKLTLSDQDRQKIIEDVTVEKQLEEQKKLNLKAYEDEGEALKKIIEIRNQTDVYRTETELIDKGTVALNHYRDSVVALQTALQATKGNLLSPLFNQIFSASLAEQQAKRTEDILTKAHEHGLQDRKEQDDKVNKEIADEQVKDEQEAYNRIAGLFTDVMNQILGVGAGSWKDMLENWYKQFEAFVAQLIAKWAATQFVTSWESGGNGLTGGSNGGIFGALGGLFNHGGNQGTPGSSGNGSNGTQTPPAGGGGGWGTVAAGAGVGAAIGSQAGLGGAGTVAGAAFGVAATAWVIPVYGWIVSAVAVAVGVIATVIGLIAKNKGDWAKIGIGLKEGEYAIVQLRGDKERLAQLNPIATGLINGLNEFITAIGGTLDKNSSQLLEVIGRSGHGKDTNYFVEYGNHLVANFGQDFQAAMEFATIQALKTSKIQGLSPEVTAAIQNTQASTLEALQSDIEFAQKIHDMGLGQIAQAIEHDFMDFQANLARAEQLKIPTDNLFTDLANRLGDLRNQILGIHLTPIEQLHHDVEEFNRQLDMQRAQLESTITTQQLQADSAKLQIAVLKAQLQAEGVGSQARLGFARVDMDAAAVTAEGVDLIAAALAQAEADLAAADQAIADAQRILDSLPHDITPDEEHDAEHRLHKGNGKGDSELDNLKQMIDAVNKAIAESGMSQYERSLYEINQKWDEEIKKLGKHKKAIDEANAAREKEIELLRKQTAEQVRKDLQPYQLEMAGKSQWDKQLQDIKDKFSQMMKDAIASGVPKWQVNAANQQANKDLGQQALASLNTPTLSTINQFKTLTDTLSFLRDNAATLGLTIEDVGKVSSEVGTQMFVSLADSLMQNINNAEEAKQLNQIKWDLEVANYKLQVELLEKAGILTQEQIDFLNHEISELPTTAPTNNSNTNTALTAANIQQEAAQTQAQAANNMQSAVESLVKYNDSLLTDKSLSPLTPQQQLDAAKAAYEAVAVKAQLHDPTAIQDLSGVEKTYLEQARSFYGSGGPYSDIFNQIRALNALVIAGNGGGISTAGNVVYGAFGQSTSSPTVYEPSASGSSFDVTPVVRAIYDLRTDINNDLHTVASAIDDLSAKVNAQQGAMNRLLSKVA